MIKPVHDHDISVRAIWERRAEKPEVLAARFVETIDNLQPIDPVFALWTCGYKRPKKFETMRERYAQEVADGLTKDDWGEPEPINGYWFGAVTREQARNRSFSLSVHAGSTYPWPFPNDITLSTNSGVPDPVITTYEVFKPALLAIVETWDPDCAKSLPDSLLASVPGGVYFHQTWIQYLCPWLASLVTPPASCLAERLPNGGLLMSATAETFNVENLEHMAVARDMAAAIAPLNALPWEERARA